VYWWPLLLRDDEPLFRGLFAFTDTHTLRWWRLAEVPRLPGLAPLEMLGDADGSGDVQGQQQQGSSGGGGSGAAAG
jgi:hypothetical protein